MEVNVSRFALLRCHEGEEKLLSVFLSDAPVNARATSASALALRRALRRWRALRAAQAQ
jgi:hypothetical protein